MADDLAAVVMAAGLGTRMKSATPKHLHPLLGRRMVDWVIRAAQDAGVERVVVVASPDSAGAFDSLEVAVQAQPLGTGDAVRAARDALGGTDGDEVAVHKAATAWEVEGINTRAELAFVAARLRDRINEAHMLAGVTIVDPASTWIDADVELEPDVTIHPFCVLRGAVRVASGTEIGPFAYVRPGTEVGRDAKIGTFVEVKKARIGARAKVPHLSYIGDAEIGEATNVAAGNITANFPHERGKPKGTTRIGRNVRTGVDNTF